MIEGRVLRLSFAGGRGKADYSDCGVFLGGHHHVPRNNDRVLRRHRGVPTWERCKTWLRTPAYIPVQSSLLDLLIPLSIGFAVAGLVWWLLGFTPLKASE